MIRDRNKLRKVMIVVSVLVIASMILLVFADAIIPNQPINTPNNVETPPSRP